MTEILFYHLQRQPLEAVLPALLEKTLERGWRAVVPVSTQERATALDDHLWPYRDDAFLPHGLAGEPDAASQPVVLTPGGGNPNDAAVRFLVDGAPLPEDLAPYDRVVLLFDGNDPDALDGARAQWRRAKSEGLAATYWQQDERGRWAKKA